jgi:probable F420-dependent oxidoreductase
LGISLVRAHPASWGDLAVAAEAAGYESLWLSDHLVLPARFEPSRYPNGQAPPINPRSPMFDTWTMLAFLAARTERLRFGTFVYLLGLREVFAAARAIATFDVVSEGRLELGVGAGWMPEEWEACGLDFRSRGARLDETLAICKALWTRDTVGWDGPFHRFASVCFEPKPRQRPHPPIHVGGESAAAIRRALAHGDGFIGMNHTPDSARPVLEAVRREQERAGREQLTITVAAEPGTERDPRWLELGIDRLLVSPWRRAREAAAGLESFIGFFRDRGRP